MRWDRELSEQELFGVVVERALALLTGEEKDNHLDSFLELGLHHLDPVVDAHTRLNFHHLRFSLIVAAGVEALLHRALELVGDLTISVTMEDSPVLELNLSEHLALDLAIDLTCTLFDVEARRRTTSIGTHQEIAGVVLDALQLLRSVVELEVPEGLLFLALLVGLEVSHQVLDLLDLGLSIRVNDLCHILHQSKVSTHCISQTGNLTQLWD